MHHCTIVEILEARERRQKERRQAVAIYGGTAVSVQLNIPGQVKDSKAYRNVLLVAVEAINHLVGKRNVLALKESVQFYKTGPEALFIFDVTALKLKKLMVTIEEQHPLGRLFDIDVYDEKDAPISRKLLTHEERKCFVCRDTAKVCGRSRRHDLSVVIKRINQMITTYEGKK